MTVNATSLTDEQLLEVFESSALSAEQFDHRQHMRAAWTLLRKTPLLEAIKRYTDALRQFTNLHGVPEKYHETVTWSYLLITHERIRRCPEISTWAAFAGANPDLLDGNDRILNRYYCQNTLQSDFARHVVVFPDVKKA